MCIYIISYICLYIKKNLLVNAIVRLPHPQIAREDSKG